jgi:hypothetical protein
LDTYESLEGKLSLLFFGQTGKTVAQMRDDFAELAAMHASHPEFGIEHIRADACTTISTMMSFAAQERYGVAMRTAYLRASATIVVAYQETFPGAVSKLRDTGFRVFASGTVALSNSMLGTLAAAKAGNVKFVRAAEGLRFSIGQADATDDMLALLGVRMIEISDDLEGVATITMEGLRKLR